MSTRVAPEPLLVDAIDVVAERFGEELVRRGHVLLAMAEQDGGARAMGGASGFGHEGGLPEAGFTAHEHDLPPFAVRDTFERCGEHCRLHVDDQTLRPLAGRSSVAATGHPHRSQS